MLTLATDAASSRQVAKLAETYPSVYAGVGIHPNDTGEAEESDLDVMREVARGCAKVVAIGETGLDYYRDRVTPARQRRFLELHLELARELNLPVVLHARSSGADLLEIIEPFLAAGGRAVWHCFLAGKKELPAFVERAKQSGLRLGLGGIATYEDQKPLRAIIPQIPDRLLLLETDAPFLLPRPAPAEAADSAASRRNEPLACRRVAEELARLRGVTPGDILRITTRNACEFLELELPTELAEAGKIAYAIRDSLYLALTNQCSNDCGFCARNESWIVKGHDIRLAHEPEAAEVLAAAGDAQGYKEVVFCGFGEPTLRLDTLKAVARELKRRGCRVRLNTNGQADLVHERSIAPELAGLVDAVSISLNSADPEQYVRLCRSRFGARAQPAVIAFARACREAGLEVTLSVVALPEIDIDAARQVADDLGVAFRVRPFADAG